MSRTITCCCCERAGDPASAFPAMRTSCWLALPQVTRMLYTSGGLPRPRVVEIAKERNQSVRVTGGGRQR